MRVVWSWSIMWTVGWIVVIMLTAYYNYIGGVYAIYRV